MLMHTDRGDSLYRLGAGHVVRLPVVRRDLAAAADRPDGGTHPDRGERLRFGVLPGGSPRTDDR